MKGKAVTDRVDEKLAASRSHWKKTFGERALRAVGIGLAMVAVALGVKYGLDFGRHAPAPPTAYVIKREPGAARKVLFLAHRSDSRAQALQEAIQSYFGADITQMTLDDAGPEVPASVECVIVVSNQPVASANGLSKLLREVVARQLPLFWIGQGFGQAAPALGFAPFAEQPERTVPTESYLTYKDVTVGVVGAAFVPGYPKDPVGDVQVLATLTLYDTFARPAIVRSGRVTYIAFSPFSEKGGGMALPVTIDVLSAGLGRHRRNPRVLFRLEDINGLEYGLQNQNFEQAANYLLDQGVPIHVGVIPVMVDAAGAVQADISAAGSVLDLVKKHASQVELVQHGTLHYRDDPRNRDKGSGRAYEFFFDDDKTMGKDAAALFARKRLEEGREVLARAGLTAKMFEAPHLEMSPAEEEVAMSMFPAIMHPPLFFGESNARYAAPPIPWMTERKGVVFAPRTVGYIDALDVDSVQKILQRLDTLARILPDPMAVVFFHPFMLRKQGREKDLQNLIEGIKRLDYRFVGMMDEIEPVPNRTVKK